MNDLSGFSVLGLMIGGGRKGARGDGSSLDLIGYIAGSTFSSITSSFGAVFFGESSSINYTGLFFIDSTTTFSVSSLLI
jgi:hypothetical protein